MNIKRRINFESKHYATPPSDHIIPLLFCGLIHFHHAIKNVAFIPVVRFPYVLIDILYLPLRSFWGSAHFWKSDPTFHSCDTICCKQVISSVGVPCLSYHISVHNWVSPFVSLSVASVLCRCSASVLSSCSSV